MGLLALALAMASCSMVRLAYNQAPEVLYWWLDGYFDFTEVQRHRVREDLAALQQWHRRQELPAYAHILRKLQRLAPQDVTAEQVCDVLDTARERALVLADALEPTIVALAPTLSESQLAHVQRQFDKRNRKWRREWLDDTPAALAERRVEQAVERAERFYGRLEEPQRAAARAGVAASAFDARRSLAETERRQRDALQTLRLLTRQATPDPAATQAMMRALFERALNSPDAAYRDYLDALTRSGCEAVALLHNSTNAAQRAHAVKALQRYEEDLRALAR